MIALQIPLVGLTLALLLLFAAPVASSAPPEDAAARALQVATGYDCRRAEKMPGKLKAEAFSRFNEYMRDKELGLNWPKNLRKLVSEDSVADFLVGTRGNTAILYCKAPHDLHIAMERSATGWEQPRAGRRLVAADALAAAYPPRSAKSGVNPATRRPWFPIPDDLHATLEQAEYYEALSRVLSSNFGVLLCVPNLDVKKENKRAYIGKLLLFPSLEKYNPEELTAGWCANVSKRILAAADRLFTLLEPESGEVEKKVRRAWGHVVYPYEILGLPNAEIVCQANIKGPTTETDGLSLIVRKLDGKAVEEIRCGATGYLCNGGPVSTFRRLPVLQRYEHLERVEEIWKTMILDVRAFMRQKGVEPGVPVNRNGLTGEQKLLAGWHNILVNYAAALEEKREQIAADRKITNILPLLGRENSASVPKAELAKWNERETARR